ncbi:hypothetical protein [Streptomyces sp. 7N604]|uniref:hypothetical protein n=1 Tax=Streptomyces sp. 7N604 TaxID=3457415 RepID=UPI003FD1844D
MSDVADDLEQRLDEGIGHYMAAIAEELLDDGVPVRGVDTYTVLDDPDQAAIGKDLEGNVSLTPSFQRQVLGTAGEAGLHWCAVSGWCLLLSPAESRPTFLESARWLGAGLLPTPGRVAAFLSAARLEAESAGSRERPFYRTAGTSLENLAERLAVYLPTPGPTAPRTYQDRYTRAAGTAYRDRALKALLEPKQDIIEVPLRTGELEALRHLLDFTETAAGLYGPEHLAHHLAADLIQRARSPLGAAAVDHYLATHRYAIDHAANLEEQRRKMNSDD